MISRLSPVYLAQFISAFADNALLIVAIGLLKTQLDNGTIPWLQAVFLIAFIVLAPWAGVFADAFPKGRVMMLGNSFKLLGTAMILITQLPLVGYSLVGIGAALYSPAKYGILTQLVKSHDLIKANGGMEASTLMAILLGVVTGGIMADWSIDGALWLILGLYALAGGINLLIPRLPAEKPNPTWSALPLMQSFWQDLRSLWQHGDARFSLLCTSLFWSVGSMVRLMLFAWVPAVLLINDNQLPATLMGAVSIGIMIGAALAAWRIPLQRVHWAFWGGIALTPLLVAFSFNESLNLAVLLLVGLGAAGGWFVVPLNALLQYRGHHLMGTGRALAVQNLFENIGMFVAVSIYGLVQDWFSIQDLFSVLAGLILMVLWLIRRMLRVN